MVWINGKPSYFERTRPTGRREASWLKQGWETEGPPDRPPPLNRNRGGRGQRKAKRGAQRFEETNEWSWEDEAAQSQRVAYGEQEKLESYKITLGQEEQALAE